MLAAAARNYALVLLGLRAGDDPGQNALFDAVLTNALVAIVGKDWPARVAPNKRGRVPSATELLTVIEEEAGPAMTASSSFWDTSGGRPGTRFPCR